MMLSACRGRITRRALTLSAGLALLLFCIPTVFAAERAATIVIAGHKVPFGVTPYLGDDGQVYAPVDAVRLIGANFAVDGAHKTVTVTGANGSKITVPYIGKQGHACVAVQKVADAIGAETKWKPSSSILEIQARLEMVRQDANSLAIYTSYPVSYHVEHIDKPSRIYVDLYGLNLAAAPTSIPVVDQEGAGANVLRIRSGQLTDNTVRITIDLKHEIPFTVASTTQTDRIRVALGGSGASTQVADAAVPDDHETITDPPVNDKPVSQKPPAPVGDLRPMPINPRTVATRLLPVDQRVRVDDAKDSPQASTPDRDVRITNVTVAQVADGLTQVAVTATGATSYHMEKLDSPDRLAFDLSGASLDDSVSRSLPGPGPIIKAVRSGIFQSGVVKFGRIVVDLSRMVGFTINKRVAQDGTATYLINIQTPVQPLQPPTIAQSEQGNSLAGKIVVVDPGHGGKDSGAVAPDHTCEKNIALAIGKKLRDVLAANGATVYMTRDDDTFIPLDGRPGLAVARHADYFISVHCDDAGGRNSHMGTTVYYHGHDSTCRRFAIDVINRVSQVSGLPANGVKSDTIRFQSGFAVLRKSPMPAILVESGYMNSDSDLAKLKNENNQEHIAEGIVAGLRDFVADQSAQ